MALSGWQICGLATFVAPGGVHAIVALLHWLAGLLTGWVDGGMGWRQAGGWSAQQ